jgi:hypothetical protein
MKKIHKTMPLSGAASDDTLRDVTHSVVLYVLSQAVNKYNSEDAEIEIPHSLRINLL